MPTVAPPLASRDIEEALIPLSALQHWLFCPRQASLIHVERIWAEDHATAEGRLLHAEVDRGRSETRPGFRVARSVQIRSLALGVVGRADVVELRLGADGDPIPFPVEYKRGKPKAHRADEVQLCAQAICLEEAFAVAVTEGALFYGEGRRRIHVTFDADLRALTAKVAAEARQALLNGVTPRPVLTSACRLCSLHSACRPEPLERPPAVRTWLARRIRSVLAVEPGSGSPVEADP